MLKIDDIVRLSLVIGTAAVSTDAYDTGLILGSSDVISTSDRMKAFYSLEAVAEEGFATSSDEYKAAAAYFGQDPAPEKVYIGRIDTSASTPETATEVLEICLGLAGDFYGVYVCGVTDAQVLAINTLLGTNNRGMLFFAATDTFANVTAAAGIATKAYETDSQRLCGVFNSEALTAAAIMGRVAGLMHSHKDSSFSLGYQSLAGATTVNVTEAQLATLKELNCNAYVTRGWTYNCLEQGTTASGLRVDEVLYLDELRGRIQEAIFGLMVDQDTRLPQNDQTNALFVNAISEVLEEFVARQIIATGIWRGASVAGLNTGDSLDKGYYIHVDSFNNQSSEDRAARKGMPITVCLCMAGSVESVQITVYAQR